jgi:hypothetical protein
MRAPAWAGEREKKVLRGDDAWEELNISESEDSVSRQEKI